MKKVLRKRRKIRVTKEQERAIVQLRFNLAEAGHLIFPVAPWYKRHRLDFIALPKDFMPKMTLVRPTHKGHVEVRPYAHAAQYTRVREIIEASRRHVCVPLRFNKRQLPFGKDRTERWLSYLEHQHLEELKVLIPTMIMLRSSDQIPHAHEVN